MKYKIVCFDSGIPSECLTVEAKSPKQAREFAFRRFISQTIAIIGSSASLINRKTRQKAKEITAVKTMFREKPAIMVVMNNTRHQLWPFESITARDNVYMEILRICSKFAESANQDVQPKCTTASLGATRDSLSTLTCPRTSNRSAITAIVKALLTHSTIAKRFGEGSAEYTADGICSTGSKASHSKQSQKSGIRAILVPAARKTVKDGTHAAVFDRNCTKHIGRTLKVNKIDRHWYTAKGLLLHESWLDFSGEAVKATLKDIPVGTISRHGLTFMAGMSRLIGKALVVKKVGVHWLSLGEPKWFFDEEWLDLGKLVLAKVKRVRPGTFSSEGIYFALSMKRLHGKIITMRTAVNSHGKIYYKACGWSFSPEWLEIL